LALNSSEDLRSRLELVKQRIANACARAGRSPSSVGLLAVSKGHSLQAIRNAYALGLRGFGENYVQELVEKSSELEGLADLQLRFIGHLQRNKVKDVLRAKATIDTIDSVRLAQAIAAQAYSYEMRVDVLLQVNVAGEAQKSGVAPEALGELIDVVRALPTLELRGLMTIPPQSDDPDAGRNHFRTLASLARTHGLSELSMGMSDDLEVAIEEGATMVRVGTALFGPRPVRVEP
jgi:PLP dependent protein